MSGNANLESLAATAAKLGRRTSRAKGSSSIPALWFLTDPVRTPDPASVARRLPAGTAVVYRAFGAGDALAVAQGLRRITQERNQILLIGADADLANAAGADGVHLPERLMHRAQPLRQARPTWVISAAAHDARALRRGAAFGLNGLLVSAVFPSRSPSASAAMGTVRFAALIRDCPVPVIALGGVTDKNAPRLLSTGAAGLAAVEGLAGG